MQQPGPGIPVPCLQARDEKPCQIVVAAHHRKLPHGSDLEGSGGGPVAASGSLLLQL
jgi:hypothetical protein